MQIVIPMSGFGERFRRAGYALPKPLIEVDGLPIISHVINMFPGETDFIFICNEDHLADQNYKMAETLKRYCPTGKIVSIAAHKLGPVYAVAKAYEYINDDDEVIVNYCDFTCDWDYQHFKTFLNDINPDGCIPAYRGFHPHLLGSTSYAYVRETDSIVDDIQEKQPYTDNPMNEFASSGTYYFKNGLMLKKYFKATIQQDIKVNNEYYVSMVYKPMLNKNLKIFIYEIDHFMQWGTPQDLAEYMAYSKIFSCDFSLKSEEKFPGTLLLPMVGLGSRFSDQGYKYIKPLIPVSGKPMYAQALQCLPKMEKECFILREDSKHFQELYGHIQEHQTNEKVVLASGLTEGQACSCMLAENFIDDESPLLISACDHGLIYNEEEYKRLLNDDDIDIIVWTIRGYANAIRFPHMYGWVSTADNNSNTINKVSVKKELGNVAQDPIITGTFTFKQGKIFKQSVESLFAANDRINNEFYVDSCINHALELGFHCVSFEVESYICWGTPNDLKCFEYWQDCFNFWDFHKYSIEKDHMVPDDCKNNITTSFQKNKDKKSRITKKSEEIYV